MASQVNQQPQHLEAMNIICIVRLKRENAYRNRDGRRWSAPCSDLRENGPFWSVSCDIKCLSRACPGKMINFSIKSRNMTAFLPAVALAVLRQASSVRL
eukprot:COSAG06_NODE_6280_length_3001_cov_2.106134_3_plen_99_part_00